MARYCAIFSFRSSLIYVKRPSEAETRLPLRRAHHVSIKITFGRPKGDPIFLGPFNRLVFVGSQLRTDEAGSAIASHEDHAWRVKGERYSRLDILGPLVVVMSKPNGQRVFGPFTSFSCVDGVAYTENRVFAFVDNEQADWYCLEDGHHWKTMETREKA